MKADRRSFFPSSSAVRAMPTFIIFYKGQKIDSVAGASPPKLTVRILAFLVWGRFEGTRQGGRVPLTRPSFSSFLPSRLFLPFATTPG